MNWIEATSEVKPFSDRPIICYCPDWNESGYQIAKWEHGKFQYDEDPNGSFDEHVEQWCSFMEAD